jgi:3,4-dihydroxy 2-butanone 4-phosphate synthase/GTP cyclohydrolase II
VVERVPVEIAPRDQNRSYLKAKKDKLGHLLNQV